MYCTELDTYCWTSGKETDCSETPVYSVSKLERLRRLQAQKTVVLQAKSDVVVLLWSNIGHLAEL